MSTQKLSPLAKLIYSEYQRITGPHLLFLTSYLRDAMLSKAAMRIMSARQGDDLKPETTTSYLEAVAEITHVLDM